MKLTITKHCHCIRKFKYDKEYIFDTKEETLQQANKILKDMETGSCHAHALTLEEKDDQIVIKSEMNYKSW